MLIPETINLLYIEDDEYSAAAITAVLKSNISVDIVHKSTLEESFKYLKTDESNVDIILLDLVLSNSSGVDTYKKVAKKYPFIPVVIISGYEDMACECVKLGAQDYLVKPHINGPLLARSLKYAIERKKIEIELRNRKREITDILESITDGFFSLDNDLRVIYFNTAAGKLLGRKNGDDIIGKKLFDCFPEAKGSIFEKKYRYALKEKKQLSFETNFKTEPYKNWYNVSVYPTNEGIAVYFQVVTARKEAEQVLKKKEAEGFSILESKIIQWHEEMNIRNTEREKQLKHINVEIISMSSGMEI